MVQSYVDHDWAGAEASLRRDMRLNPGSTNIKMNLGSLLLMAGCPAEALDLLKQGLEIDPMDARKYYWLGSTLTMLGRLDEAEQAAHTTIDMDPERSRLSRHLMLQLPLLTRAAHGALAPAAQAGGAGADDFPRVGAAVGSEK